MTIAVQAEQKAHKQRKGERLFRQAVAYRVDGGWWIGNVKDQGYDSLNSLPDCQSLGQGENLHDSGLPLRTP